MAAAKSQIIPELPIIRGRRGGEPRATFFELFFDLVYTHLPDVAYGQRTREQLVLPARDTT